jgi:nucleoside-diphosphate-sugar epimerase
VARALLVGCGCRGRELGRALREDGWEVRGTTRDPERAGMIEEAGIEAVVADPDRIATVVDHVGDVTLIAWLMGSASGEEDKVSALHGPRLERLLSELVDTPVRGFVYEAAGSVGTQALGEGAALVGAASERWRIPVALVKHDPTDWEGWAEAARTDVHALLGA